MVPKHEAAPRSFASQERRRQAQAQCRCPRPLCIFVKKRPDATLAELQQRSGDELGITLGIGALSNTLCRLNLTLKKSVIASEQNRPDVAAARDGCFCEQLKDVLLSDVVVLDDKVQHHNYLPAGTLAPTGPCECHRDIEDAEMSYEPQIERG